MNFTKQYLSELAREMNFNKDCLEKVLRLSDVLRFINTDDYLKGKLALKGGTAINLLYVNLPRLSVDIDLDLAINTNKEQVEVIRKNILKRLNDYMWQEGYSLSNEREEYSLVSCTFNYINSAGNRDNIKVEINFINRCHILPLESNMPINKLFQPINILTLNKVELYASKINALIDRATPRDLYDVYVMIQQNIITDTKLLRKCLIFYNMIGGDQKIDQLDFSNIENLKFNNIKTQLMPVISKTDHFDFEEAKIKVIDFLKSLLNFDDGEMMFIQNFKCGIYMPNLLFDTKSQTYSAVLHPASRWRCQKLVADKIPLYYNDSIISGVNFLKDIINIAIDNSNKDEFKKMMGKLCVEVLAKQSEQERITIIQNYIKGILVLDNTKRQLYNLKLDEDIKTTYIFQIDQMIQVLENCHPISKNQLILFNHIRDIVNTSKIS